MYKELFGQEVKNAHDALEDATALYEIMSKGIQFKRKENDSDTAQEDFIHEILKKSVNVSVAEKIAIEQIKRTLIKMKTNRKRDKSCLKFLALKDVS